MIQKVKNALKKRKVKLFLIFFLCSGLAWFISKLSETYTSTATFDLHFVNAPADFLLSDASKNQVDVKLRAVGFQFLGFNVKNEKVTIDLSKLQRSDSLFLLPADIYRKQIEKQLPSSMTLLEMDNSSIYFDFKELKTKKLLVKPKIKLNLAQNYLLDGEVQIAPNKITIKGPASEIDTLVTVETQTLDLTGLTADFSKEIALKMPSRSDNITYSETTVLIKGKVARFSEKILKVPVTVINLPTSTQIRTFPDQVSILVKGKIEMLKTIKGSDFQVIGDYSQIEKRTSNIISIKIAKKPKDLYSARLNETQVEFILNREQ